MHGKKVALGILAAAVIGFFAASLGITMGQLPDELTVYASGRQQLSTFLPVSVDYNSSSDSHDGNAASARLFGLLKVKAVNVSVVRPQKVKLAGTLFGVRMYSDGVMVVGLSDFKSGGADVNPAREAGVEKGDVIKSVNGKAVRTNSQFSKAVTAAGGAIELEIVDGSGQSKTVSVTPRSSDADQCLKTGMWVRDSAAGIGTLTYIDPENRVFGGLGHGICDSDTQNIVPVSPLHGGEIVEAEMSDIRRGVKGAAGEIRGYLGSGTLGEISANTICGAFGRYTGSIPSGRDYEVALKQTVRPGRAKVLCTADVGGKPQFYDIIIDKINYNAAEPAKNMIITVTDQALLKKTGGIVQGMSGSPIVQNGKFVGAVTHVFVNNPTCGYAIFAENMVRQGETSLRSR